MTDPQNGLLRGLRVLDFGRVLAAPHAARWMADFGADVIKLERPKFGDDTRFDPHLYEPGLSGSFMQQNWGKRSLGIDLRHPEARPIVERLIEISDVLFENFRPGVMERMGFGWERVHEINPRLVMCSVSAYGQTGPYAMRPGYGPLAEAVAGIPDMSGEPDGPPMPTVVPISDNLGGAMAFGAVCAALYAREHTGVGDYIDISLMDAAFQMHDIATQQFLATGGKVVSRRRGLRDVTWVPWGFFKAADGWVCIMCGNESFWPPITAAMGKPELAQDPRYANFDARIENRDQVYGLMDEWAASLKVEEIVDRLVDAGVPVAPVNTIGDAIADPQVEARGLLKDFNHPRLGPMRVVNSGFKFGTASADVRGLPPYLGEHSKDIVCNLLGYDEARYEELVNEGVLDSDTRATES